MDIEIYKALSDESRQRIFNLLMQRELCVCEIEKILEMSQSNVSRHLNKLKNANMVVSKKDSQWAYYSISDTFINNNHYLYEHLCHSYTKNDILLQDRDKLHATKQANCD
ncbi:MAG: metalloregulator ArsR/SmtB family transcription factor [Firmicutes bacterium]|nr:metalloregulator ArsR/SmtB family transcription factor [Bacillota bacterium]